MPSRSNTVVAPFILPTCCMCHRVAGEGSESEIGWIPLQAYLDRHHLTKADVALSHTYCPTCYHTQAQAWHIPQRIPAARTHLRRARSHR